MSVCKHVGVFLGCSPPYFWRHNLSPKLELPDLFSLTGHQVLKNPLCNPSAGVRGVHCHIHRLYRGSGSNSDLLSRPSTSTALVLFIYVSVTYYSFKTGSHYIALARDGTHHLNQASLKFAEIYQSLPLDQRRARPCSLISLVLFHMCVCLCVCLSV